VFSITITPVSTIDLQARILYAFYTEFLCDIFIPELIGAATYSVLFESMLPVSSVLFVIRIF
jgi:hypothetical protein